MGSACCGRKLEGKKGLQGFRRKNKRKGSQPKFDEVVASPFPNISADYTSIPNEFNKRTPTPDLSGVVGLENLGNTCFINSAL
jgi:ubiquitin C-terminal hydrolase